MKATMSRVWKLFLVFASLSTGAHGQDKQSCSDFKQINEQLQNMKNCCEAKSVKWSSYEQADIFNQLRTLTDIIQKQQNAEVLSLLPGNCSAPAIPSNGGLLCVSTKERIYCKPMCNTGYDFHLLRRSRLYEACSADTQHKWTTQYIGGNRLADCTESHFPVAGIPSAYFPEGKDCHKTKSDEQQMKNVTSIFHSELIKAGITSFNSFCLFCGQIKS